MDKKLIKLIKKSNSWEEFKLGIQHLYPDKEIEVELRIEIDDPPLSDFNKKLKKGLEYNPKGEK